MKNIKIIWEEPPAPSNRGRQGIMNQYIAVLKDNPNRWAKIKTYARKESASSSATTWRKRFKTEGFEIVSRNDTVYARFVTDEVL